MATIISFSATVDGGSCRNRSKSGVVFYRCKARQVHGYNAMQRISRWISKQRHEHGKLMLINAIFANSSMGGRAQVSYSSGIGMIFNWASVSTELIATDWFGDVNISMDRYSIISAPSVGSRYVGRHLVRLHVLWLCYCIVVSTKLERLNSIFPPRWSLLHRNT